MIDLPIENAPEGVSQLDVAWTLNTNGPGAHRKAGNSTFILSPVSPCGEWAMQVVELEEHEKVLEELTAAREAATLYKLAGDGSERAQALAELLNVLGLA